ncbi:MAG: AmmeMemoRadiSam system radical SAM enzyme [Candidatus Omnitrophota bacterium]
MKLHKVASKLRQVFCLLLFLSLIGVCFYLPGIVRPLGESYILSFAQETLREAYFYKGLDNKNAQCQLCPRFCVIPDKRRGFCGARENRNGILYSLVYARPCAIHIDPIEKKPLFHFLPASYAFSIATAGCNLKCLFCQNWQISQAKPEEVDYTYLEPRELVERVKQSGTTTIAYTYTEPVIFYEYMLDTAKLARAQGIKNVMHSNGYINEEPLRRLCKYLDAANIDLKGFSRKYYSEMSQGALEPVLRTLKILKEEGVWIEITNLILTGLNDDSETMIKMCLWIKENLGDSVPVHFSRFRPMYKMLSLNPTPVAALEKARKIALDCGLKYIYIGNIPGHAGENTYCPNCGKEVISRSGYTVLAINLDEQGRCKFCLGDISGVWK